MDWNWGSERLGGERGVQRAPSHVHPFTGNSVEKDAKSLVTLIHAKSLVTLIIAVRFPCQDTHSMAENREPRGTVEAELDPVEYTLRKRLPHRLPRRPNDIYVNMKTDFKAQLARCQKLLDGGARGQNACTEIYIHGLGLAINRAINIALQLQAALALCRWLPIPPPWSWWMSWNQRLIHESH
jgi:hypothetical protein